MPLLLVASTCQQLPGHFLKALTSMLGPRQPSCKMFVLFSLKSVISVYLDNTKDSRGAILGDITLCTDNILGYTSTSSLELMPINY